MRFKKRSGLQQIDLDVFFIAQTALIFLAGWLITADLTDHQTLFSVLIPIYLTIWHPKSPPSISRTGRLRRQLGRAGRLPGVPVPRPGHAAVRGQRRVRAALADL